jgi:hypothetical protein
MQKEPRRRRPDG